MCATAQEVMRAIHIFQMDAKMRMNAILGGHVLWTAFATTQWEDTDVLVQQEGNILSQTIHVSLIPA